MGKRAKRKQAATMNQMNQQVQQQVTDFSQRQEVAQQAVDVQRAQFEDFQFQNPFAGVQNPYAGLQRSFENVYEDLTVDTRAAEFAAQQGEQQRANILQGLRGAAGTSGVAGLAQTLANQGVLQSQQISATIGQQEAANQRLAARGAAQVQQMEASREQQIAQGAFQADVMRRQGEAAIQQAEFGRESTLLGMDYGLLAGANQAEQQAMANQMSAMGMKADMYGQQAANNPFSQILGVAGTVAGAYAGSATGSAAIGAFFKSDRRLKKNINKIGKSLSGLNIYSFEYKNPIHGNGLFQGVMSDEIPQEAVVNNGRYDMVNYNMLDVEFKQI